MGSAVVAAAERLTMTDADGDRPKMVQLGEGFHVRQSVDNIAWVDLGDGLLVVDALEQPELEQEVFAAIESTCPGKGVKFVLNTHTHYDHVALNGAFVRRFGAEIVNQEVSPLPPEGRWFGRGADILSASSAGDSPAGMLGSKEEDAGKMPAELADGTSAPRAGETPTPLQRRVHIQPMPGCHTAEDCTVLIEPDRVLFVGDLFGWGCIPLIVNLRADTLRTLEDTYARLIGSGAKTVVPGHGPLCTTEELARWIDYLHGLIGQIKGLHRQGRSEAQIVSAVAPPADMTGWWRFLKWKHADCAAKVLKAVRNGWI